MTGRPAQLHGTGCEQEPGAEEAEARDSVYLKGTIGGTIQGDDWAVFGKNPPEMPGIG